MFQTNKLKPRYTIFLKIQTLFADLIYINISTMAFQIALIYSYIDQLFDNIFELLINIDIYDILRKYFSNDLSNTLPAKFQIFSKHHFL